MHFSIWALLIGALLIGVTLSGTLLKRLPVSTAMLYLLVGCALGPLGLALMAPNPYQYAAVLERVTEVALLISLFSVGLKLGLSLSHPAWHLPLRLALGSMLLTVGGIAAVAYYALNLPLGAAILLGGILAPTDPVLAGDVQVSEPADRDHLRFSLSGEGGLNDAAAYPFVMLGLGLLGLHELGTGGWRWLVLDVGWAMAGGVLIGSALGALIGRWVVRLRIHHQEALGLDEFLSLGLVALAYGAAQLVHASGFLAVFAAGMALQRVQSNPHASAVPRVGPAGLQDQQAHNAIASHPKLASAYMMQAVRGFNNQLERVVELAIVLMIGALLYYAPFQRDMLWFLPLLFLLLRPLAVWVGLLGAPVTASQRLLISWFGIRGIGSVYYMVFAINHGLPAALAEPIVSTTLATVAVSIVLHGISVTPLMQRYARQGK